jgi:hypothetical protein
MLLEMMEEHSQSTSDGDVLCLEGGLGERLQVRVASKAY